jgi:hypothetical protein
MLKVAMEVQILAVPRYLEFLVPKVVEVEVMPDPVTDHREELEVLELLH